MAGEDLDYIWRNLRHWKGETWADTRTVLPRHGTLCPAQGCHSCADTDCPYADFIRHYWNYPHGN